jgi:WD40 repeat protein
MPSFPRAFDTLRCTYGGATDSITDIDVDPHGGCAYAATCSGDVLVWDVATQLLKVQLRHSQWVNAVRCFPLANSAASVVSSTDASCVGAGSTGVPLAAALHSTLTAASDPATGARVVKGCGQSEIRWVLTGSEDGVVAVWSPMTYRTQIVCQLCPSAITTLQLMPYGSKQAIYIKNSIQATVSSSGGLADNACTQDPIGRSDAALLCAASLHHIHILQVTSATPQLVLLRSLQHTTLITAVMPVCTSAALPTQLLAVGQEDGTLCLWNCTNWLYHDTLFYPAAESDLDEDARLSPDTVHEPLFERGAVLSTFAYNRRRCNPCSGGSSTAAKQLPTPQVSGQGYQRHMPGALTAAAAALVERRFGPLPSTLPRGTAGQLGGDLSPLLAELRYDARRITCLASTTDGCSASQTHLFSGHATGEVLLWGCLKNGVPFLLLKKLLLFKPGAWVWRMCAVKPLVAAPCASEATTETSKASTSKSKSLLHGKAAVKAKANAAAVPSMGGLKTLYYSPLELVVWSDGGTVQYVSTHNQQLTHREGPGFMASAAACWIGETFAKVSSGTGAVQNTRAASVVAPPRKAADAVGAPPSLAAHQYVLMGNFEGRVERYDVSKVMGLVRSVGKAL